MEPGWGIWQQQWADCLQSIGRRKAHMIRWDSHRMRVRRKQPREKNSWIDDTEEEPGAELEKDAGVRCLPANWHTVEVLEGAMEMALLRIPSPCAASLSPFRELALVLWLSTPSGRRSFLRRLGRAQSGQPALDCMGLHDRGQGTPCLAQMPAHDSHKSCTRILSS